MLLVFYHRSALFLLAVAALFLVLVAVPAPLRSGASREVVSPHITNMKYRAHEVCDEGVARCSTNVKKFSLQKRIGSDSDSELSWQNLSVKEVAALWKCRSELVEAVASSIKQIGYSAVFFESVPVTRNTVDKPYEYVLVDAPRLASVSADGSAFADYIGPGKGTNEVVSFRNLRKDSRLIAPCDRGGGEKPGADYTHLAAFVRTASDEQVLNFFSAVGEGLEEEIASRRDEGPVWLSTSGLGVYWLHARLDSVPKYYTYVPFKTV